MCGMRAPCQFPLSLDQAPVKIQCLSQTGSASCSPKSLWVHLMRRLYLTDGAGTRGTFSTSFALLFHLQTGRSQPVCCLHSSSCFLKSLVNPLCLCSLFQILLRLCQISASHAVGRNGQYQSPKQLFQNSHYWGPNPDLLRQNGEGLRVRGRWKMGWCVCILK